ncbi:protease PrsW [Anaerotignum neopropionicum]|uniref:Protease PrsW n=1 Tax=Anaerotignum neopropionicum TaxID=36847 RepID=A0A136WDJ4_9FIRM|nr:PrsW family glutamic-type intramembrane protease [Anaerotignum neopropionicum]KXL52531.1 protease PrsW [Anaerotignum neopropionicum]
MLIQLAAAPVFLGLFYIYVRDKYEKEPWKMLFLGLLYGIYTTAVIYAVGLALEKLFPHQEIPLYTAFISSAGVEEVIKYVFLVLLIWKNGNFNEPLDGIVYGVFVSLGFAWIENIIYVTHPIMGGYGTALSRAVLSVPGHGLFGVQMGYYLGLAKFFGSKKNLVLALFIPYLAHALYNYFLLEKFSFYWIPFWILEAWLWWSALRHIKELVRISPFRE